LLIDPGELLLIGRALIEQSQHLLIRRDLFGLGEQPRRYPDACVAPVRAAAAVEGGRALLASSRDWASSNALFALRVWRRNCARCAANFSAFSARSNCGVIELLLSASDEALDGSGSTTLLRAPPRGDGAPTRAFTWRVSSDSSFAGAAATRS